MPGDNPSPIASGSPIAFPSDGVIAGTIIRSGPSSFVLPAIGIYRVDHDETISAVPSVPTALSSFAVIAGSTVTNTGATVLNGNLALSPGSSVTGFPPGVVAFPYAIHIDDATAAAAQAAMQSLIATINGFAPGTPIAANLNGVTFTPGVYDIAGSASLSGTVTFNGAGQYYLLLADTLTTAAGATFIFTGDATPATVFWRAGSSFTFGTGTTFAGNALATASITANTGATFQGGLWATAAVTLGSNVVFAPETATPGASSGGQVVIELNGTEQPSTLVGIANAGQLKASVFIITTTASSVLRILNPASGTQPLTLTPSAGGSNAVTAHLLITQKV
jgi:hypothetical protein